MNSFWPSYSSVVGHEAPHQAHRDVLVVVDLLGLVVAGDLPRRVEQEHAEHVEDPVEALDQLDAGEDEDGAQHERAEDAPEQHAELVLLGHGEEREDHGPHEDVVDRQALFDEEAGVVLAAGLAALPEQHDDAEEQSDRDPHRGLDRRLLERDDVGGAVDGEEVDDEHQRDRRHERHPGPEPGTSKLAKSSVVESDAASSRDGDGKDTRGSPGATGRIERMRPGGPGRGGARPSPREAPAPEAGRPWRPAPGRSGPEGARRGVGPARARRRRCDGRPADARPGHDGVVRRCGEALVGSAGRALHRRSPARPQRSRWRRRARAAPAGERR